MSYCTTLKRVCKVTSTFSQAFFGRSLSCTGYPDEPDEPQNTIKATSTRAFPDLFESANFSLRFQKFRSPHVSVLKSKFARPHVSDQYPTSIRPRIRRSDTIHSSTRTPMGGILPQFYDRISPVIKEKCEEQG